MTRGRYIRHDQCRMATIRRDRPHILALYTGRTINCDLGHPNDCAPIKAYVRWDPPPSAHGTPHPQPMGPSISTPYDDVAGTLKKAAVLHKYDMESLYEGPPIDLPKFVGKAYAFGFVMIMYVPREPPTPTPHGHGHGTWDMGPLG